MATVKVSNEIKAPVDRVFAMFTDIENGSKHVSGIKGVEMMTFGPFRLGTKWRETREVLGTLDEAEMEVTAFEQNATYTITHHKAGVRIDTVFTFEPTPVGSRVSIEFGLNPQGLPPALLAPLEWAIAGRVKDVLSSDLLDLKQSAERLATTS
jgi:uncharacterized protein YndB with AHSA1/START domain